MKTDKSIVTDLLRVELNVQRSSSNMLLTTEARDKIYDVIRSAFDVASEDVKFYDKHGLLSQEPTDNAMALFTMTNELVIRVMTGENESIINVL